MSFSMWVEPVKKKKYLYFGKDFDYILDTKNIPNYYAF